jgi:hypothetical protein
MTSNTPPPPRDPATGTTQSNTEATVRLTTQIVNSIKSNRGFQRALRDNTRALTSLPEAIIQSQNVTNKLTEAIKVADRNVIKSLSMGISYQKFLESNTEALNETEASRRETTAALIDGFDKGLNTNSGAVMDLTERMLLTGQDTKKLNSINADLMAVTGRNESVIQAASKATLDASNRYKISADRLIDTMQAMSEVFEEASFFGGATVGSLDAISKDLRGMVGVDMVGQIAGFLKTLTPSLDNIATQSLLGAENVTKKIAEGTASTSDLMPILRRIQEISDQALQSNPPAVAKTIAAAQLGMSERQLTQALQLARAVASPREVDEAIAASNEEMAETLKTAQEKANDFYDRLAPGMHGFLATIAPAVLSISQLISAGGLTGSVGSKIGGKMGGFGKLLGGIVGFAGPVGLALGLFPSLLDTLGGLFSSSKEQTEAAKKQAQIAEEERRLKQAEAAQARLSDTKFLAQYLMQRLPEETRNSREVLELTRRLVNAAEKEVDDKSVPSAVKD